jgi:hypothetical protein
MRSFFARPYFFWLASFFFLGITFLYVNTYNAYQPVDKEWLKNSNFTAGFDGWKMSNTQYIKQDAFGVVSLSLSEPKYLALYQRFRIDSRLPKMNMKDEIERTAPLLLQLSGVARTSSIRGGKKEWHQGRLSLVFYDEKGKRVGINAIPLPAHQADWREYKKVFAVHQQVASVRVNVHLFQATGTVEVKEIHLVPVKPKIEANTLQWLGLAVWISMIIWLMFGYARYVWTTSKVAVLLVSVVMLGAILSGDMKQQLLDQLPELLFSITPFLVVDKDVLAHFVFFFIAALILIGGCRYKTWWKVVIDLILLGLFIECAQVFVEGRSAELKDLWVDIIGIVAGGFMAWLGLLLRPNLQPIRKA